MAKVTEEQKDQAYVDDHREKVKRILVLSQEGVRQFLGTRAEGDPRVEYLTSLEASINMAQVQVASLRRLVTEKLGVSQEDLRTVAAEELDKQLTTMEEELAVIGWNADGTMKLDLQAHREKTQGWPP